MASFFKKYKLFITTLFVLSCIIISLFYNILSPEKILPIYQPAQVNYELVDSTIQHQKKYHHIADFSLINQNGDTITQEFYKNKIYVELICNQQALVYEVTPSSLGCQGDSFEYTIFVNPWGLGFVSVNVFYACMSRPPQ